MFSTTSVNDDFLIGFDSKQDFLFCGYRRTFRVQEGSEWANIDQIISDFERFVEKNVGSMLRDKSDQSWVSKTTKFYRASARRFCEKIENKTPFFGSIFNEKR